MDDFFAKKDKSKKKGKAKVTPGDILAKQEEKPKKKVKRKKEDKPQTGENSESTGDSQEKDTAAPKQKVIVDSCACLVSHDVIAQ